MLALDKVTAADFNARLQEDFELITGTGGITLRLAEVEELEAQAGLQRRPFVLRFQGATELRLPQSIYRLENVALVPMEIFLVQIQGDTQGSRFEAVFS